MQAYSTLQAVLFFCLLLAASVWDLRKRIIPDSICFLIALTGLMDFSLVRLWGVLAALPLEMAWESVKATGGIDKMSIRHSKQ